MPTIVAAPTISPESCEFAESQEVTITQSEGADIYYTTDDNKPTSGSQSTQILLPLMKQQQ